MGEDHPLSARRLTMPTLPAVRNWEVVVGLALLVTLPSIIQALDGAVDVTGVFVRFLLAGLLSWACVAVIERMWGRYNRMARQRLLEELLERRRQIAAMNVETGEIPD